MNDNHANMDVTANDNALIPELPFLVTHWLCSYQGPEAGDGGNPEREEAIERLRNATSEMAAAFSSLGAYGTSSRPSFRPMDTEASRNATFGDLIRRWQPVPSHQLESLVQAAASATRASESAVSRAPTNLLLAAQEYLPDAAGGGRRLTDGPQLATTVPTVSSVLQTPALIGPSKELDSQIVTKPKNDELSLAVESDSSRLGQAASKAMREYLTLRQEHQQADVDIKKINRQVIRQQVLKDELEKERASILANGNEAASEHSTRLYEIAEGLLNTDRLIPQHMNNLSKLEESQRSRSEMLSQAKAESESLYSKLSTTMKRFRDPGRKGPPLLPVRIPSCVPRENSSFFDTITRQYGAGGSLGPRLPKRIHGATPSDKAAAETRKCILAKRLTYFMTASAHLAFPVYCLAFDKTGRYFVTGADDCLVKVFYIGAARSNASTQCTFSYGSNDHSAVLVCTLRGHAGVICDVDVSADNAFLATASDDGDVRVWGLKDGTPIAILRGHRDGANMVSWSKLTPYRLVSSSSDGLARMWDIREAAVNRYGTHVGKRSDYKLPSADNGSSTTDGPDHATGRALASGADLLPPLPLRNGGSVQNNVGIVGVSNDEAGGNVAAGAAGAENVQPGQFVRNEMLDEGVRLVTKLQHGAPPDESGAATRSRRKAVKVICIARCPRGGHFATGAEDGICRVWSEENDGNVIAREDLKYTSDLFQPGQRAEGRRSTRVHQSSEGRLLAVLTGHVNSITDLHYSNCGDRLLSASQKDGVTRVWSWTESSAEGGEITIENVKQILLQTKKPETMVSNGAPGRRRAGATNNASCDVAVWTTDDARIVTSQCCHVTEGKPEIVEGSQYLLVWDSLNGQCLMGISNAHNAQVPVVIPHPLIPTLLCSAGGDGIAKLWDLEKGECIHLHENKILDIGPAPDTNEQQQRKNSGYLDGSFSPDGLTLVLTDDSGRFTLFAIADGSSTGSGSDSSRQRRSSSSDQSIASWMKEQYFANDYYELYFDTNGYCVERGSGQPPHLAPRSARCSFTGSAWAEEVNDTFSRLAGPVPLPEDACRRNRNEIRYRGFLSESGSRPENNRANLVSYFDPLRTVLIDGDTCSVISASDLPSPNGRARHSTSTAGRSNQSQSRTRTGSPNGRSLSSNYRWVGYEDIMAEEAAREEEEDAADDEYAPPPSRSSLQDEDLSDDISMTESSNDEDGTRITTRSSVARSSRTRRRRRTRDQALSFEERERSRPTRVSARQMNRSQPEHYEAESDADGYVDEFLSTNNTPSGPHVEDYTVAGHYFRLPDSGRVKRQWLLRTENKTSHMGIKNYAPQVGDSVVYIPRAHYETIKVFPTLDAPWKHFEQGTRWPVVRCTVKDIRYRFPYEQYYRSQSEARCLSIVAILTLEVTGIPALSSEEDTVLPWPKPSFVERRSRNQTFEVSMYESDCPEFVIPESLFTWRLQSIENATHSTRRQNELSVVAYFSQEEPTRSRSRSPEDEEMIAYPGTVVNRFRNAERVPDGHLRGSGFATLEVEWDGGGETSVLSPWELTLLDKVYETPNPPTLSESASRAVANALAKIESLPQVDEYFLHPVDERRYSDYRNRVEIPMNYSFIKERLAAGYYSNVRSVLSDAKLISVNCLKYNGPCELSQSASDIYDEFVNEVTSHVDIDESPVRAPVSSVALDPLQLGEGLNAVHSRQTRNARIEEPRPSRRSSIPSGSDDGPTSLERLPMPEQRASVSRQNRRRTTETHRSRSRGGLEQVSRRTSRSSSGRPTRSSSAQSVLAMEREDDSERADEYIEDESQQDDDESAEESSESVSDVEFEPQRKSRRIRISTRQNGARRATRTTGRTNDAAISSNASSSAEEEQVEEEESARPPARSTRRATRLLTPDSQHETRSTSRRSTRASQRSTQEVNGIRRSTRTASSTDEALESPKRATRTKGRASLADLSHSEVDDEEDESPDNESEVESSEEKVEEELQISTRGRSALKRRRSDNEVPIGSKRRRTPSTRTSPRTSGRPTRRSRATKSFADSSDSEDDNKNASSEDEEPPKRNGRNSKRTAGQPSDSRSSKRTRSKTKGTEGYPDLQPWPNIPLKKITGVSKAVLNHLSLLDVDELFAIPVIEKFPEVEKDYVAIVESPMDFRTIEEDRLPYYEHIQELQDDLILVFRNCATFNDTSTVFHSFAITMWEQLNDVFRNVCDEQGVKLPRRW